MRTPAYHVISLNAATLHLNAMWCIPKIRSDICICELFTTVDIEIGEAVFMYRMRTLKSNI